VPPDGQLPVLTTPVPVAGAIDPLRTVHNSVYSEEAFALETERLFRRAWYLLCHDSEVPASGSFLRRRLGGDPVLVLRGADGAVRGFHNVCRHRGCLVVPEERGCARALVCPYHHWSYSTTDGSLLGVPHEEAYDGSGFARGDFGLVPLRCESVHGFVFGCIDEQAPPVAEYLGPDVLQVMESPLSRLALEVFHVESTPFAANWKTFAENIRDGYHVPFVHPWLRRSSPPQPYTLLGNHHAVQQLRLAREAVTEEEWLTTTSHPLPGMEGGAGYVLTIFPDSLIIVRSGEVHTMTVTPLSAAASTLEIRVLGVAGEPPEVRRARQACYDLWSARQPPEDVEVLQYQQQGLASRSVQVSLVARGGDATAGRRGDDNRLRQFWAGWRAYMGVTANEVPPDPAVTR
jgi:phenylpropionate dioxygenase-like ring-hydroxylating dioxygenase large terminal subunit